MFLPGTLALIGLIFLFTLLSGTFEAMAASYAAKNKKYYRPLAPFRWCLWVLGKINKNRTDVQGYLDRIKIEETPVKERPNGHYVHWEFRYRPLVDDILFEHVLGFIALVLTVVFPIIVIPLAIVVVIFKKVIKKKYQ